MKFYKVIALLLGLSLFLSANLFAQEQEMTEEEWQSEMNRLAAKQSELTAELNSLQNDVNNLKSTKAGLQSLEEGERPEFEEIIVRKKLKRPQ